MARRSHRRKGRVPPGLARYWAARRAKSRRASRSRSRAIAKSQPKPRRRRAASAARLARAIYRRSPMARSRRGRRRASRRSGTGPAVSVRGFTSAPMLKLTGGAVAGLIAAPIASIKIADAMRDKAGKSPLDGPLQNVAVTTGIGIVAGLALKGVDRQVATGAFVGSAAGGIATALVAYLRKNGAFKGLGDGDYWVQEASAA